MNEDDDSPRRVFQTLTMFSLTIYATEMPKEAGKKPPNVVLGFWSYLSSMMHFLPVLYSRYGWYRYYVRTDFLL